jgi:hypothetical protein
VPSQRSIDNEKLTGLIRQSFAASDNTYGSRRVWRDVREWGHCVSVLVRRAGFSLRSPLCAHLAHVIRANRTARRLRGGLARRSPRASHGVRSTGFTLGCSL